VKILHVTPSFYPALVYGGPVRSVYDLCGALASCGEQVRVLTTDANGVAERLDVPRGVDVPMAARGGSEFHARYARRVGGQTISTEFLRAISGYVRWADVVHLTAVYSFPTLPTLIAARLAGKPVIVSPRGSFGAWGLRRHRRAKAMLEAAVRVAGGPAMAFHATSESEAADIRAVMGDHSVVVVPNGVDDDAFRTLPPGAGRWLRHAASLKEDDGPIIGCLGRLHRKKALDRVLGAVPALVERWPGLHVVFAGPDDGDEQVRLTRAAHALHVGDRVHFLGALYGPERISFLAGLDVFALPSEEENFGNVIAEALAASTPVVASRRCPWPELETRRCGRWIDPEPHHVAEGIADLLGGDARLAGLRGREFVMQERTALQGAHRMLDAYRSMVAS
jgi:glycosyltransferase involved in cell wall biosynthesis